MPHLRLDRLSVAQRILAGFGIVLLLLGASAFTTFQRASALSDETVHAQDRVQAAQRTSEFELFLNSVRRMVLNYMRTEQGEMLAELKTGLGNLASEGDRLEQSGGAHAQALKEKAQAYVASTLTVGFRPL
jgi:hypothetical protein